MKHMFKVDYQGATLLEKNFAKNMLSMVSGDVCVEEEFCLVFCTKGKAHILDKLEAKTLQNCRIEVTECSKDDFSKKDIRDFFERIEAAQERIISVLRTMG